MMVDVYVCVGGSMSHNLLSRQPNIMLVKKNNM